MVTAEATAWLLQGIRRQSILLSMNQPLTISQLSRRTGIGFWICDRLVGQLARRGLLMCITEHRNKNRVFWLTLLGRACLRELEKRHEIEEAKFFFPDIDYRKYSSVCYSQRGPLLRGLKTPEQPVHLRKKVIRLDPSLRMSANNARDAIKAMLTLGLVEKDEPRKRGHAKYRLTDEGGDVQMLLWKAEEKRCLPYPL
jgi:predicted transcriptional regulator